MSTLEQTEISETHVRTETLDSSLFTSSREPGKVFFRLRVLVFYFIVGFCFCFV